MRLMMMMIGVGMFGAVVGCAGGGGGGGRGGGVDVDGVVLIANVGAQAAIVARDGVTDDELDMLADTARMTLEALDLDDEDKARLTTLIAIAGGDHQAMRDAVRDEDWLLLTSILTTEYLKARR